MDNGFIYIYLSINCWGGVSVNLAWRTWWQKKKTIYYTWKLYLFSIMWLRFGRNVRSSAIVPTNRIHRLLSHVFSIQFIGLSVWLLTITQEFILFFFCSSLVSYVPSSCVVTESKKYDSSVASTLWENYMNVRHTHGAKNWYLIQ